MLTTLLRSPRPHHSVLLTAMCAAALQGPGALAQKTEDLKLLASDGVAEDYFGYSVAIDGSTALVGSSYDDDNGNASGSVYVYDVTTGQELFKLTASDASAGQRFGYSVALSGSTALIGAIGDGTDPGDAYLFDVTSGQELFKLTASDAEDQDLFGISVAISGNRAVVGSYLDDDLGSASGAAYVFDVTTGQELLKLTASDGSENDLFGLSVAMSGNTALIGSPFSDGVGADSGSAYLFNISTGQELLKLTASDAEASDLFGHNVTITSAGAVVGAFREGVAGSAYLFDNTGQETFKLTPSDGAIGDEFGCSVALYQNVVVIGAFGDDDNGSNTGSAYVFNASTGAEVVKLTASDPDAEDWFGVDVAINETAIVVGAPTDFAGVGASYVYLLDSTDCVTRYCDASQNPNNASVVSISSCDSSADSILVGLSGAPANQFVYLLVGDGAGTVSQPPGAKGDLCIVGGSCLGRYDRDVGQISGAGNFATDIKNAVSTPCAGAVNITPGATWNFQYWHRQPMGQPATFSDAISVTFQ